MMFDVSAVISIVQIVEEQKLRRAVQIMHGYAGTCNLLDDFDMSTFSCLGISLQISYC